jgi:hypothetical protein
LESNLGIKTEETEFFLFSSPFLAAIESAAAIVSAFSDANVKEIHIQD